MRRVLKIIISLPKTIWFNFRYLPFANALKLPVWIAANARVNNMYRGGVVLKGKVKPGLVRIGYHEADAVDTYSAHTILNIEYGGKLIITGDAHIGHGAIINVKSGGLLSFGMNFAISGTTCIICNDKITFGDDVQLSWNSLITDSDAHQILSESGQLLNPNQPIYIGNKVWIAANTTILKGTTICDNTVVASNSLVNSRFMVGNCIVGGTPAKLLKKIGGFRI